MNISSKILILTAILSCAVTNIEALSCVQCASCTRPWKNSTDPIAQCLPGMDACSKLSIIYNPLDSSAALIMKACVPKSNCKDQELLLAGYGFSFTCCTTDGCNSATFLNIKLSNLVFSLLVIFIFKILN